ncbi:hypothetical protein, partial [Pueribacillus sp. YX66]|uniref:hypothetical protein n=1 Tax=Pueribacillus sp. YX66 TaxID=3229242 RepID=UPI00358D7676
VRVIFYQEWISFQLSWWITFKLPYTRIEEVSDETIRRIKKIHNKDMLLYRFAQKLLKKHLSKLDDQQLTELRDFKNKQIEFELNHEA